MSFLPRSSLRSLPAPSGNEVVPPNPSAVTSSTVEGHTSSPCPTAEGRGGEARESLSASEAAFAAAGSFYSEVGRVLSRTSTPRLSIRGALPFPPFPLPGTPPRIFDDAVNCIRSHARERRAICGTLLRQRSPKILSHAISMERLVSLGNKVPKFSRHCRASTTFMLFRSLPVAPRASWRFLMRSNASTVREKVGR